MSDKRFVIADVFAEAAFAGNQLAVFTDATGLDAAQMQRAANEIGYSETTFVLPPESPDTDLRLRIFTPHAELPFAGHPCVGSGFVAAVRRLVPGDPPVIRFGTGVGPIEVRPRIADDRSGSALMGQPIPALVHTIESASEIADIAGAISVEASSVSTRTPIAVMDNGLRMMIVPLDSLAAVRSLEPNIHAVRRVCERTGARTLLAFTTEVVDAGSTAHCRVFAPAAGVSEDPATGSANGPLGVYLSTYGLAGEGEIVSEQGYEMGRPSKLKITVGRGADGSIASVHVGGGVFITGEATLFL